MRLFERDDRRGGVRRLGPGQVRSRLAVELTGADEALEARRDVPRRARLLEDEIGELLQRAELLVEPQEAILS